MTVARIRVAHSIGDLANDLAAAPVRFVTEAPGVVLRNAEYGNAIAQRIARENAGPHGKNYWKRLSAEMTGPMEAEYGPVGTPKTEFVGVGFRNGGQNMDLPNSADIAGPKLADEIGDLAARLLR